MEKVVPKQPQAWNSETVSAVIYGEISAEISAAGSRFKEELHSPLVFLVICGNRWLGETVSKSDCSGYWKQRRF